MWSLTVSYGIRSSEGKDIPIGSKGRLDVESCVWQRTITADLTEPQWVNMFRDIPGPELVRSRGCWRQKESVTQAIKEVEQRERRAQELHFEEVLPNGHTAPQLVKPQ